MKLLAKYNRVNLITTIVVMLITGIIYYQAISWILTNQNDKDLVVEEQEVFDYVKLNHQLPQTFQSDDQQITFTEAPPGSVKREFINTIYFKKVEEDDKPEKHRHHHHHEYEAGRGLVSSVTVGNQYYKILIVESKVETEDLIQLIFTITICVILLLLVTLVVTNRLILNRIWQPFYSIMKELRGFNIADTKEIPQVETTTDEFKELNKTVVDMAARAKLDYKDLKIFTENASHELLTPIAVINSKLDTLIQTENFSPQQSKLLNDLYGAVSRLNRLNQSLLLLVKIENRLLHEQQQINLKELTEEMIGQFEEIFQDKDIQLNYNLDDKEIYASHYLLEILLSNLINNAIRHNYRAGSINITLTVQSLIIQNTGESVPLAEEKIFTRFHKSSKSEGSGLGLTICRQICENFNYTLNYSYQNSYHTFTITF
ncbi:signal transduction histidine kinase [Mucilaginibacter frigoritolerans]|jgi:signal transduction histidine kinase|uniref:histidine kinase n=1 Tax=Mucilaginibacter frigoritolerans TaxID=652788 RepID=A0A562U823_9SPHI|nr:HAMP domain-containing sensor histidine kinase [Mucilaginibacter frigoritolerans]TWJ01555.1 signal transduction histidine kinase [Mucilaginibacter frigoritolerans]